MRRHKAVILREVKNLRLFFVVLQNGWL